MAWALAYLGTLAAACFVYRETRRSLRSSFEDRLEQVETALASPQEPIIPVGYDELRETVSTLAMASGLKPRGKAA